MKKKPEAEADVKDRGKYHGSGGGRSDGGQSQKRWSFLLLPGWRPGAVRKTAPPSCSQVLSLASASF